MTVRYGSLNQSLFLVKNYFWVIIPLIALEDVHAAQDL